MEWYARQDSNLRPLGPQLYDRRSMGAQGVHGLHAVHPGEIGRRPRRPCRSVTSTGSAWRVPVVNHELTTPVLNALTDAQADARRVLKDVRRTRPNASRLTPPGWPAEPLRRQARPDADRARSCSTSNRRRILPDALLGICATSSQRRIRLYGASRSAANARTSSTATPWSFSTR